MKQRNTVKEKRSFVEATEDVALYKKVGYDYIGKTIAEALVNRSSGVTPTPTPTPEPVPTPTPQPTTQLQTSQPPQTPPAPPTTQLPTQQAQLPTPLLTQAAIAILPQISIQQIIFLLITPALQLTTN